MFCEWNNMSMIVASFKKNHLLFAHERDTFAGDGRNAEIIFFDGISVNVAISSQTKDF